MVPGGCQGHEHKVIWLNGSAKFKLLAPAYALIHLHSPGHGGNWIAVALAGWQGQPQIGPFAPDNLHMLVLHVANISGADVAVDHVAQRVLNSIFQGYKSNYIIEKMSITYTKHALARMAERGISQQEVEATLNNPFRQIPADHGRIESQGFIQRSGNKQLLRVITEGDVVVLVVTVMATSKFEKYGVSP